MDRKLLYYKTQIQIGFSEVTTQHVLLRLSKIRNEIMIEIMCLLH